MKQKNTRRGNTQTATLFSVPLAGKVRLQAGKGGVQGKAPSFNNSPSALRATSSTSREGNGGFTLIELLVVVLIIGILVAVALPQYNKVVKRAQGREVYVAINALDKALHTYYLENGTYRTLGSLGNLDWEKLNISIPELEHFNYFVGSLEKEYTDIYIGTQGKTRPTLEIKLRWRKGKLEYAACRGDVCVEYFECPEYVRLLQLSSVEKASFPNLSHAHCDLLKGEIKYLF